MPVVRAELGRMLSFAEQVNSGAYKGHSGERITDIVNIGIGGSDLGLVMAVEALRPFHVGATRSHFVSNIDGSELADAVAGLDPARTLFIICSKSFTTLETQLNADAARRWLVSRLSEAAVARHFVAVSVNAAALDQFGIAVENRFSIWDWVGGRYSLWSAVGLAIAIAIGPRHYEELLAGAAELDEHFRTAPLATNLPVILGLVGVWNQNCLRLRSHVVLPYSARLRRFPAYLQQLEMESNGKGVLRTGEAAPWETGSVLWGEPGSNAQHAFFQLLHQGTAAFSADFIAPAASERTEAPDQHLAGLANMLAQAEAFARGRNAAEALRELPAAAAATDAARRLLAAQKVHPGNHPSTVVLLPALNPRSLGALIALYEHKVFTQSVIWGINPFDQWGVELGKSLAHAMSDALRRPESLDGLPGLGKDTTRSFPLPAGATTLAPC
jgi:glucose-6-phosphate isomerase